MSLVESTRYSKALKAITDAKKQKSSLVKDLKRDLDVLQTQMCVAVDLTRGLEEAETRLQGNYSTVQKLDSKVSRQEGIVHQHESAIRAMQVHEADVKAIGIKIEEKTREVERAFEACEYVMEESDAALQMIVDGYDAELEQAAEGIEAKEEEQRTQALHKAECERQYNTLCVTKGRIEAECLRVRDMAKQRENKENELCSKYRSANATLQALANSWPFDEQARRQFGTALQTLQESKREEFKSARRQCQVRYIVYQNQSYCFESNT